MARQQQQTMKQRKQQQKEEEQYEWPDASLLFAPYPAVTREISHPVNLAILRTLFKPRWIYENDKEEAKKAKTAKKAKKEVKKEGK